MYAGERGLERQREDGTLYIEDLYLKLDVPKVLDRNSQEDQGHLLSVR